MIPNPFTFQERVALDRIFFEYGTAVYWNDGEFLVDEDFTDIDLERLAKDLTYEGFHYPVRFAHESLLKGKRLIRSERKPSEVLQENRQTIVDILKKYHIYNPRVFGSTARGEDSLEKDSDLDIMVDRFVCRKGGLHYISVLEDAREELQNALEIPVDLHVDKDLRPHVYQDAAKFMITL